MKIDIDPQKFRDEVDEMMAGWLLSKRGDRKLPSKTFPEVFRILGEIVMEEFVHK